MSEYRYGSDAPAHTCGYLWPQLLAILGRVAPSPSKLFELGCGNGSTAQMLSGHGYSVTGVDPSESGIAIARERVVGNAALHFAVGSTADDLASIYGRFPVVISIEVIEHCASARGFMRSFLSVLAPGGVGILSTPYHGYLKNLAVVASGRFDHHFDPLWENGHLKFFTIAKLRQLLRELRLSFEFHRVGRIPALAKSVIAVVHQQ